MGDTHTNTTHLSEWVIRSTWFAKKYYSDIG